MKVELKDINWESETEKTNLQSLTESTHENEIEGVLFEYNGYKLNATVKVVMELKQLEEEETGFKETVFVDAEVEIVGLYDNGGNETAFMAREIIAMENELKIDFKIQY